MAKNDFEHPEEARRAQDLDVPGITLPEGTHHTGRGMWEKEQKWTLCEIKLTFSTQEALPTHTPPQKKSNKKLWLTMKRCDRNHSTVLDPRREAVSERLQTRQRIPCPASRVVTSERNGPTEAQDALGIA